MSEAAPTYAQLLHDTRRAIEASPMRIAGVALGGTAISLAGAHVSTVLGGALPSMTVPLLIGSFTWSLGTAAFTDATIIHVVCARRKNRRPTLGESVSHGLRRVPAVALAKIVVGTVMCLAALAFVAPVLYFAGRFAVASAVATMEPGVSPAGRSSALTRGLVLRVVLALMTLSLPFSVATGFGAWIVMAISGVSWLTAVMQLFTHPTLPTLVIGFLCQSVMTAMTGAFEGALFRRLTRKSRSLGEELAEVFR